MATKKKYDYIQKNLTTQYGLTVDEDGIFYYSQDLKKTVEVYFPFTEVAEKKKVRYETNNNTEPYMYIALGVVVAICLSLLRSGADNIFTNLIGFVALSYGIAGFWINRVKNVCIPIESGNSISYLFFFENKPNKESGDELVEKIYKARAVNYRERYFKIIESNDKDTEIGRMEWLFREQIISKPEYQMIVELINETFDYEEE